MESLELSVRAVLPIFLLMLLGYLLKRSRIVDHSVFDGINKLSFYVFLPVLLFNNIYSTSLEQVLSLKLVLFCTVLVLIIFAVGSFAVLLLTPHNDRRGVMLQGFFRSNVAFLGIPLMNYICQGRDSYLFSLTVAVIVPLFNVLAVICLERFRGGKIKPVKLIKGVITNPLIIGCAAGLLFLAAGIRLPQILHTTFSDVASVATTLAMITLGADFEFTKVKCCIKELLLTVCGKLIIVPLLAVILAILSGFRAEALASVLVVFGTPVAVSSYPMARQMGGNKELAAQVVVISSVGCIITLFLFIFTLSSLGFL